MTCAQFHQKIEMTKKTEKSFIYIPKNRIRKKREFVIDLLTNRLNLDKVTCGRVHSGAGYQHTFLIISNDVSTFCCLNGKYCALKKF